MRFSTSLMAFCLAFAVTATKASEIKTFNTDLEDWSLIAGSGPGWINANLTAGQVAGEAGGEFTSGDTLADNTLGGTFTLNDALSATGEFYVGEASTHTNGAIAIGFVNPGAGPKQTIGFQITDFDAANLRFFAAFNDSVSTFTGQDPFRGNVIHLNSTISENTAYRFEFIYNPTVGDGRVTARLFNSGGSQIGVDSIYNLSPAERTNGASMSVFGAEGYLSGSLDFRLDNVVYTSVIPEPSGLILASLGSLAAVLVRRQSRYQRVTQPMI